MAFLLTILFVFFLSLMIGVRYWLACARSDMSQHTPNTFPLNLRTEYRSRHIARRRTTPSKRRALESSKPQLARQLSLVLTLLGGLQWINDTLRTLIASDLLYQIAVVATVVLDLESDRPAVLMDSTVPNRGALRL